MARKKTAEQAPATPEPDKAPEAPATAEQAPAISKMEAVRQVLADTPDIGPGDGIQAVKTRFGLDMASANFSAYKSQIRAKARGKATTDGQAHKRKAGADQYPDAHLLEAAQQVKALVALYGAETVKGLADLFRQP